MMRKIEKYFHILKEINIPQTLFLYFKVRKPKSSSIRVFNKTNLTFGACSNIVMNEHSSLELNRFNNPKPANRNCTISLHENATIEVTGHISIFSGSDIQVHRGGVLLLGTNTYINGAHIDCSLLISIGNDCAIANGVKIMDNSWHKITYSDGRISNGLAPVHIGNKVWCCSNAIILPGVTIGDGAIIAAGSVVTHDIPAKTLAAGVPARVIKTDIDWKH